MAGVLLQLFFLTLPFFLPFFFGLFLKLRALSSGKRARASLRACARALELRSVFSYAALSSSGLIPLVAMVMKPTLLPIVGVIREIAETSRLITDAGGRWWRWKSVGVPFFFFVIFFSFFSTFMCSS